MCLRVFFYLKTLVFNIKYVDTSIKPGEFVSLPRGRGGEGAYIKNGTSTPDTPFSNSH